jgi:transcriptional regulator with XRE-family HTH domain
MSDLLYLHRNTVSQWENGKSRPSIKKLRHWAQIIAERTDYDSDAVLTFLGVDPVTDIAERRRQERRVAWRQPSKEPMWISAACAMGDESLRILPAA